MLLFGLDVILFLGMILIILIAYLIITYTWNNWLKTWHVHEYVLTANEGSYDILPAKKINNETLRVFEWNMLKTGAGKKIEDLYCGVQPVLVDVTRHPEKKVRGKRHMQLYFHQKNKPYVCRLIDGKFVDQDKKIKVCMEQGIARDKAEEISDIDFCRADYYYSKHNDALEVFSKKSNLGWIFDKTTILYGISAGIIIFYMFVRFNVLRDVLFFLGGLV